MRRTKQSKLWGGRFTKRTDPLVERFTSSIMVDHRLAAYDVRGSIAHATMLGACRIIPKIDAARLVRGLTKILQKIQHGDFAPDPAAEDIHSQIQQQLSKLAGPAADKLHTARSRNDQVALDLRLYCRDVVGQLQQNIRALQQSLVNTAASHVDVVMPGYTHLQRAQPILLAHHLLAYVEMVERDHERLEDSRKRIDVLPLGCGALAGTSLPIDRGLVAKLLQFGRVADNSLDAVSDRDFVIELLADLSLIAMHLSRLAEDVVLWATDEFGILDLDDAFATGSSLMPQKKNPDVVELVRGQAGLVFGNLLASLTVLKGLPLAYNRDLQWDKSVLFEAVDLTQDSLRVLARFLRHVRVRRDRAAKLLESDSLCATDLAEYLVGKGVPARQAHRIVGQAVVYAERAGKQLGECSGRELKRISPHLDERATACLDPQRSVERKKSWGGTSPKNVRQAIARWRKRLRAP